MRELIYLGNEQYKMTCESSFDAVELVDFLTDNPKYYLQPELDEGSVEVTFYMALDGIPPLKEDFPYELI